MGMIDSDSETVQYVRFQSPHRNSQGHFIGVFGLVNSLAREGKLSDEQENFRRRSNSWYDAAYTDPSTVDPHVYDEEINPGAAAWFKPSATHLLARVSGYLEILSAHGVDCRALGSADPGRIIYEDDVQIVVVPHAQDATAPDESTNIQT
ncbi:hypothetical protein G6W61_25215 [Streptomyces sp. KAI-26]|uniref:hypothetical protein n=1 Tax=Streptomyces sp. KAI-26 TaxID=1169747 RepID=UPI0015875356|nr:hypothetical protein [Streptomyces sp. KAI-26]NUV89470.1 hypothetical protein [Streptomyces sp. KAI-26]NUW23693.1 hypothetical protein [Streptomyces roseoviolaceus]